MADNMENHRMDSMTCVAEFTLRERLLARLDVLERMMQASLDEARAAGLKFPLPEGQFRESLFNVRRWRQRLARKHH